MARTVRNPFSNKVLEKGINEGIWIDHHKAVVVLITDGADVTEVIMADAEATNAPDSHKVTYCAGLLVLWSLEPLAEGPSIQSSECVVWGDSRLDLKTSLCPPLEFDCTFDQRWRKDKCFLKIVRLPLVLDRCIAMVTVCRTVV